eukprot:TRINITY_DN41910_c0_g1_i1.p1 TRINITY_DN41910_c0_g1~~TRINITY_DN41910_c0_g1_i1.p1  ORF type:complete len:470 (-),score=49.90 TRINITY_DN41910_c0_g1_i1:454-1863(-)
MALFDRRLLAYFDDSGNHGTLLDQITDHQQALAEIELELCRYRMRINGASVVKPPRNRKDWILRHRSERPVQDKYGHYPALLCGAGEGDSDAELHRDIASLHRSADDAVAGRRSSGAGRRSSNAGVTAKARGRRQSATSQASLGTEDGAAGGARHTAVHKPSPSTASASGSGEAAHPPGSTWVQLDTITGLPPARGRSMPSDYIVCARWEGNREGPQTEPKAAKQNASSSMETCVVRQQLKLPSQRSARFIVISVFRREATDSSVGTCRLDTLDRTNQQASNHPLVDNRGQATDMVLRVRLSMPSGPRPSIVAAGGVLGISSSQSSSPDAARVHRSDSQRSSVLGQAGAARPSVVTQPSHAARATAAVPVRQPQSATVGASAPSRKLRLQHARRRLSRQQPLQQHRRLQAYHRGHRRCQRRLPTQTVGGPQLGQQGARLHQLSQGLQWLVLLGLQRLEELWQQRKQCHR